MLAGRIALVATIVVGQLWGLTVALNAWHDRRTGWRWGAAGSLRSCGGSLEGSTVAWPGLPDGHGEGE